MVRRKNFTFTEIFKIDSTLKIFVRSCVELPPNDNKKDRNNERYNLLFRYLKELQNKREEDYNETEKKNFLKFFAFFDEFAESSKIDLENILDVNRTNKTPNQKKFLEIYKAIIAIQDEMDEVFLPNCMSESVYTSPQQMQRTNEENDGESFTTTTKITFKSSHMVEAMATKITEILHQDQTIDFLFNRFIEKMNNYPQITPPNRAADGLSCHTPNRAADGLSCHTPNSIIDYGNNRVWSPI